MSYIKNTKIGRYIYDLFNKYNSVGIIGNSIWSIVGEIISKGFIFLTFVIVARILGRYEYGQFGIIRTSILMFATFGGMGLGLTANKYISQEKKYNKVFAGKIIGLTHVVSAATGFFVCCLVYFFAEVIAIRLNAQFLTAEIKISAGILFFSSINGAQIGILQGLESFKRLAISNLIQSLFFLILLTIGTYYWGVIGTISTYLISTILYTIILELAIYIELKKSEIKTQYSELKELNKIIFYFTIPAALTGIIVSPFKWFSETLIVKNGGFAELGIFQAAIIITTIIITISSGLNAPLISVLASKKDSVASETQKLQYFNIYGSWFFFLIISFPFILFPNLILYIFGEKFNDPTIFKVNLLLLLYCGLLLYYQGITRTFIVNGYIWLSVLTNIVEGVSLIGYIYVNQNFTSIGLSKAYVFSYVLRIVFTIPFLLYYRMIPRKMLYDKYFILSLSIFLIVILRSI